MSARGRSGIRVLPARAGFFRRASAPGADNSMKDGGGVLNKRSIPIAIVSCILALAGLAGYFAVPVDTGAEPARLLMENPGGRVVFTHKDHATPGGAYGDIACAACHHDLKIAGQEGEAPSVMLCTACHGTADDPDFIASHQDTYRAKGGDASCISCHHGSFAGLSDKWSHEAHFEYSGEDCESCHHPDYARKSGQIMLVKPQKCSNCHTARPNPLSPTTLKDASHIKCRTCHEELFESGSEGCATCHTFVSSKDAAKDGKSPDYTACSTCHGAMIGGMDAYHGNCMSCHDKAGKGPGKEAPCTQCHTP